MVDEEPLGWEEILAAYLLLGFLIVNLTRFLLGARHHMQQAEPKSEKNECADGPAEFDNEQQHTNPEATARSPSCDHMTEQAPPPSAKADAIASTRTALSSQQQQQQQQQQQHCTRHRRPSKQPQQSLHAPCEQPQQQHLALQVLRVEQPQAIESPEGPVSLQRAEVFFAAAAKIAAARSGGNREQLRRHHCQLMRERAVAHRLVRHDPH